VKSHLSFVVSSIVVLALVLGLAAAPELTRAQSSGPTDPPQADLLAVAPGAIPIQGKLTNASGMPLTGTYSVTFRLYDVETGGTAICSDNRPTVSVQNGLFSDYMDHCYNGILNGQKVWLGIQVGGDAEMTPRQLILPVPYALALVPGVSMVTSHDNPFAVQTSSSTGKALQGIASSSTGATNGVYGSATSANGAGGYFYNFADGTGLSGISVAGTGVYAGSLGTALRASSGTGAAVSAEGTGVIRSTAKSYLWISGNDLRPYLAADTTIINMDTVGGAKIYSGATLGARNVMLPITIMAPMYGQDVTISSVDIYWSTDVAFDGINVVLMRRQTGVCSGSSCYATLIDYRPGGGISCEDGVFPTGCTLHLVPAGNNVITSASGILYLTFELNFTSATTWIDIGGVRLTLEHD
jgi:hypothetical protein